VVQVVEVSPSAQAAPTSESNEGLVARVNGEGITTEEFERALLRSQQQIAAASPEALQATVLDALIEQALIEQAAAQQEVVITDEQVEAEFEASKAIVPDETAWQQWLDQNMFTEDEFRESLHATLIAASMRDRVVQELPENMLQVHARHILVDSEAEAQQVLQRLQGGEDFGALAASLSLDVTTRDQGGDLGWFAEGELLEPALSLTAFILTSGQIGGPVPTRLGYHIVQTLESAERPMEPERRALLAQLQFENWVRGLSFNAIVERYLP
jgi:parvulin-like peptidyl-prolyl isomerase